MDIMEYLDLIPIENTRKITVNGEETDSNFMRFMETILAPVMSLQDLVSDASPFDAKQAVGNQLDIIGQYIGLSRLLPYIPASGDVYLPDNVFMYAVWLRIAQESWTGKNVEVKKIYDEAVGELVNIGYNDLMDGSIEIEVGVGSQDVAQAFSAAREYLIPAGIGSTIVISDTNLDTPVFYGISILSVEYEQTVELGGNG